MLSYGRVTVETGQRERERERASGAADITGLLGDDDIQVQGSSRVTDASRVGYCSLYPVCVPFATCGVTNNQTCTNARYAMHADHATHAHRRLDRKGYSLASRSPF